MISVIIPTLNAAQSLAATLASLPRAMVDEIIVSDGGSCDQTVALAADAGAQVITGPAGRGGQLMRGAAAARGEWLLFLHADTVLDDGAGAVIRGFVHDPANRERAAVFRFRLDDPRLRARLLERIVALRGRVFALPYGDQGLLISRDFYDRIGGFKPLALMEDVEIIRRIGRRRLRFLDAAAVTSAARYRRDGYARRMVRNACCLTLYALGVSPARIRIRYDRS